MVRNIYTAATVKIIIMKRIRKKKRTYQLFPFNLGRVHFDKNDYNVILSMSSFADITILFKRVTIYTRVVIRYCDRYY